MDENEKITTDGPIVGDVAAVINDLVCAQIPVVLGIGLYVDDERVAAALVEALAEIVTTLEKKAVAGEYAIKRTYEAWSKEDLKERDMPYMPYG